MILEAPGTTLRFHVGTNVMLGKNGSGKTNLALAQAYPAREVHAAGTSFAHAVESLRERNALID